MKRWMVWCVATAMSLSLASRAQDKKSGGTEKAIAAMEQKWADGAKASNADAIAPLLADNAIVTDASGKVEGKTEVLADAKAAKWEKNEISDVKVTVFGKTAIATGGWTGKGTDSKGNAVDAHERWTDTWVETSGGKWQCIASHSSPTKM